MGVHREHAHSVQARAKGLTPDDAGWPEAGYRGDYIADVARAFLDGASVDVEDHVVTGNGDADDFDAIRRFAVAWLRKEQHGDLAAFGVDFDVYFLESSLYADGKWRRPSLRCWPPPSRRRGALGLPATVVRQDRVMRSRRHLHLLRARRAIHLGKWHVRYERPSPTRADQHGSMARVMPAAGRSMRHPQGTES